MFPSRILIHSPARGFFVVPSIPAESGDDSLIPFPKPLSPSAWRDVGFPRKPTIKYPSSLSSFTFTFTLHLLKYNNFMYANHIASANWQKHETYEMYDGIRSIPAIHRNFEICHTQPKFSIRRSFHTYTVVAAQVE